MLAALVLFMLPSFLFAQQSEDKPAVRDRGISIFTEFPAVSVVRGEVVKMELIVNNKGQLDENIDIKPVTVPKGWKAVIRGGLYDVTGLYVPAGQTKKLNLTIDSDKSVGPGSYAFGFEAKTKDGAVKASHELTVKVLDSRAGTDDLQVTTSYPVLKGQPDSKFEFALDVYSKGEAERMVSLSAGMPDNWEVAFQPANELKQISSFRLKGGQNQGITVQITPAKGTASGEYPVTIRVGSGEKKAEVRLTIIITGVYRIDAGPTNGLLSVDGTPGQPTKFSIFVKNTGSAIHQKVIFESVMKPENWTVEFKPEAVENLRPDETRQIEVTIKPNPRALVGDYAVNLSAKGEKSDKTVEMRVIVKASTAWGWFGVGLILFVIAGLSVLFIRLGRR